MAEHPFQPTSGKKDGGERRRATVGQAPHFDSRDGKGAEANKVENSIGDGRQVRVVAQVQLRDPTATTETASCG